MASVFSIHISLVQGCTQLTDCTLDTIATYQKNLVDLNLSHLGITDDGLERLSHCAKHLRHLNIYACRHVTEKGVHPLLDHLPLLELLNIRGTGLSASVAEQIRVEGKRRRIVVLTGALAPDSIY